MYPNPWIPRLHRKKCLRIQTMLPSCLASKMQFRWLLLPLFLNGAFSWWWNPAGYLIHIHFNFIQVLFTEMLYCIPHRIRFKNTHPLRRSTLISIENCDACVICTARRYSCWTTNVHLTYEVIVNVFCDC